MLDALPAELAALPVERVALLSHRNGAAREVTGGAHGDSYHVTSLGDDGSKGTLRYGAEASEPLWITFDVDGVLTLERKLRVKADKTILGYGRNITLQGRSLQMQASNVAVAGLKLGPMNRKEADDCATVTDGADLIWLRHLSAFDGIDGAIDVTRPSGERMRVTIEYCRIGPQPGTHTAPASTGKTMLVSGDADWDRLAVTLHHNAFIETWQRNPRAVNAWVHAYSNALIRFGMPDGRGYGMQSGQGGRLLAEHNVFLMAPAGWVGAAGRFVDRPCTRAIVATDDDSAAVREMGNYAPGCEVQTKNPSLVWLPDYDYDPDAATTSLAAKLVEGGCGWQPARD